MIQLTNIAKQYRLRDQVIDALLPTNFTVQQGEFVAITGPSGSGKTTMLSILGGMLSPSAGEARVLGENLYQLTTEQRARLRNESIGFVFQNFNLVPWLTAVENVQLPLTILGTDRQVQESRALELLARFELADRADHKPSELSAGQQQRVALARTLVTDPKLILADEPTGNLDPDTKQLVLNALHQCCDEYGQTVVLVTHDDSIAKTAGRVVRMERGTLTEATERSLNIASAG
ncbi:ABC transporter ATP-binding protein [bacterium]|nr:ABC transporter ATP-binding protein [bacterium]